jgi:hypothetical protein
MQKCLEMLGPLLMAGISKQRLRHGDGNGDIGGVVMGLPSYSQKPGAFASGVQLDWQT